MKITQLAFPLVAVAQRNSVTSPVDRPESDITTLASLEQNFSPTLPQASGFLVQDTNEGALRRPLAESSSNNSDEPHNFTVKESIAFIGIVALLASVGCCYNFSEDLKNFINDSDIRDEAGQYKINKIIEDLNGALDDPSYDPIGKHSKAKKLAFLSLVTEMCASLKKQLPPDPSDQAAGITSNPNNVFASIGLEYGESQRLHEATIDCLEKMSELSDNDVFLQEEFIGSIADLRQLMVDINSIVYRDGHSHTPKIFSHYLFQSISAILDVLLGGPQNNPLASIDRMLKGLRKDKALHAPTSSEASTREPSDVPSHRDLLNHYHQSCNQNI